MAEFPDPGQAIVADRQTPRPLISTMRWSSSTPPRS